MIKMSESSRDFLKKRCPETLLESDLRQFLLALDEVIIMQGLDENDNMTELGHKLQAIYDEVYIQN